MKDETITINKKDLLAAFLEMEHQQTLAYFRICLCMQQLEQVYLDIHHFVENGCDLPAKQKLIQLLFPNRELQLSDDLLEGWDSEAKTLHQKFHREHS